MLIKLNRTVIAEVTKMAGLPGKPDVRLVLNEPPMIGDDPIAYVPGQQIFLADARKLYDVLKSIYDEPAVESPDLAEEQVKHMVTRFLGWSLPSDFAPDGGIKFTPVINKGTPHEYRYKPVGTNLLNASQAEEMVRHMLHKPSLIERMNARAPQVKLDPRDDQHETGLTLHD